MAVSKTLTANGSKGHHKFTLVVTETSTSGNNSYLSYTFTIAPIQSGWDWYGFSIPFVVTINNTNYSGSISSYNGSSTVTLKSGSNIEIQHDADGTKTINVSFSVTDNTGQNYTCGNASASGTMTLTTLHQAPLIKPATIVETNQDMIDLGVPDTTIVPWLSEKTITLDAEAFDGATLEYRIRHGRSDYYLPSADTFQASNIFNTDYRTHYVAVDRGKAPIVQIVHDSKGAQSSDMLLVEINGVVQQPDAIPYEKPTLEKTSTTIKRKSGSGTNLTDNKANVNVKGLIYKANDVIGNNNSTKYVGYKIWERETSEPLNYTSLTATTDNDGNVTVTDFEISNIDFTKAYTYKIIITDDYDYSYEIEDTVPTGQPTWTEYKDRVDFMAITVNQNPVVESDSNANGYYVKFYDGTMICYGSETASANSNSTSWTFPGEFIDANVFVNVTPRYVSGQTSSANIVVATGTISKSSVSIFNWIAGATTPNYSRTMSLFAIGRWK